MAEGKRKAADTESLSAKRVKIFPKSASPSSIFTGEGDSVASTQKTSRSSSWRPNKYICNYEGCGKAFNRPVRLQAHERTHTNERPFVCEEEGCDKAFFKSEHLKTHVKESHADGADYVCHYVIRINEAGEETTCEKTFKTALRLSKHLARHEKAEEIRCDECGMTFRAMETLQRHIKKDHLGENAYVCRHTIIATGPDGEEVEEECGEPFSAVHFLKTHERHEHLGNKYFCGICPPPQSTAAEHEAGGVVEDDDRLGFRTWSEFQAHNKEVHPPTCTTCGKVCKSSKDLTAHVEIAHGDPTTSDQPKPFPCDYPDCGRSFTKKGNLTVHVQSVHQKTKRFVCGEFDLVKDSRSAEKVPGWSNDMGCGAGFGAKASLEGHVRTQHLDLPVIGKEKREKRKKAKKASAELTSMVDSPMDVDLPLDAPNDAQSAAGRTITQLTGHDYEKKFPLACPEYGCSARYARQYDLTQHLTSVHLINPMDEAGHYDRFWIGGYVPEYIDEDEMAFDEEEIGFEDAGAEFAAYLGVNVDETFRGTAGANAVAEDTDAMMIDPALSYV
jgi:general transcription factor IIIA